jgi:hypothetical protein
MIDMLLSLVLFLIQITVQIMHGRLFFLHQVLSAVGAETLLQFLHVRPGLAGVVFGPFHSGKNLVEQCTTRMRPRLSKAGLCLCFVWLLLGRVDIENARAKKRDKTKKMSERRRPFSLSFSFSLHYSN